VIASPHGPRCIATQAVADEIARHIPGLAAKRRLDPALLFAALQVMPVRWTPVADYEDRREEAEQRIAARDPDDWPTVALALKLGLPVWSQDKDLTTAGLDVLTTGELLDALRDVATSDSPGQPSVTQAPTDVSAEAASAAEHPSVMPDHMALLERRGLRPRQRLPGRRTQPQSG
jgi:hypothetical protein